MKASPGLRRVQLLIILVVMGLAVGFETKRSDATSWYNVTVRIVGVYTNVGTRVYAGGHLMGTVYGEGTLSFNTTYGSIISADDHTPDGYPYYGYPYYSYQGPFWGSYGYNGVAFVCRDYSQTVPANTTTPITLTFRYDPLFFLYVKSDKGNPLGTGWYLAGSVARIAVVTPVEETGDTRYRFDRWIGGVSGDSPTNPATLVYMDSPKMIEASWVTQYKLRVNSPYGQAAGGGWYDRDQTATFSVTSPVGDGEGTRRVFTSWSGDYAGNALTGSAAMNSPKTVTANWKTQYLLTVDAKGGQVDKTSQWVDSGTSVSVTASSPCNVVEKNSRSVFLEWQGAATGSSNPAAIMMDAPKTLIASWRTQHYLIVETKHGVTAGEGWHDADSVAEFSVTPEVPMEEPLGTLGGKYVFNGWTADSTANTPKATITMDRAHIVNASWGSDYNMVLIFFAVVAAVGAAGVVLVARRDMLRGLGRKVQIQLGGTARATSSVNSKPNPTKDPRRTNQKKKQQASGRTA